jgi:hypothetical protein
MKLKDRIKDQIDIGDSNSYLELYELWKIKSDFFLNTHKFGADQGITKEILFRLFNDRDKFFNYLNIQNKSIQGINIFLDNNQSNKDQYPSPVIKETLNWTQNYRETSFTKTFYKALDGIIEQIKNFSTLKKNWDSYEGEKIEWETISKAIEFFGYVTKENLDIPFPSVCPAGDGSIYFEWESCKKRVEVYVKDKEICRYLIIDKIDEDDGSYEGQEHKMQIMAKIVISNFVNNEQKEAETQIYT